MVDSVVRINITLPQALAAKLKTIVPKRQRSKIISKALTQELEELERDTALKDLFGALKNTDALKFSTQKELNQWRKNLWSSWDRRLDQLAKNPIK